MFLLKSSLVKSEGLTYSLSSCCAYPLKKAQETVRRESWMTELPEEQRKAFGTGPRQFRQTTQTAFIDKSWARGPGDKPDTKEEEDLQHCPAPRSVVSAHNRERELLLQQQVDEYNKSHRAKSLVDLHREQLQEKQRTGQEPMRRSFNRETDLEVHRIDPRKKTDMLKSASALNSKFTSGSFT